jgi:hypothetical protein
MARIFFKMFGLTSVTLLIFQLCAWAADFSCDACGMKIAAQARNHVALKMESQETKTMHFCSLSCLKKAQKHLPAGKVELSDFNHPERLIPAEKAFYLVNSEKIKAEMGDMVMPPYVGVFATRPEADAAQKKLGDGSIVQGLENVLK